MTNLPLRLTSILVIVGGFLIVAGCTNFIAQDRNPPVISQVNAVPKDARVKVSWSTNEESTSEVEFGRTSSYDFSEISKELVSQHLVILTNLVAGAEYHYRVSSTDQAGNESFSVDDVFVAVGADTASPAITNIFSTNDSEKREIVFTWETDEETSGRVEYGLSTDYSSFLDDLDPEGGQPRLVTEHSATLALATEDFGAIQFHYRISASDEAGNTSTSDDFLTSPLNLRIDTTTSGQQHLPKLGASGDRAYITWRDERNGANEIYFAVSPDGGETFSVKPLSFNGEGPDIAAQGEGIYLVWQGNDGKVYFSRSTNGGTSFEAGRKVDDSSSEPQIQPRVSVAGGVVYIVWQDQGNDDGDIYISTSIDEGVTLSPGVRVHNQSSGLQTHPVVASNGSGVYVAWGSKENGENHIYMSRSDDGLNWTNSEVRIDDGSTGSKEHPTLKVSSNAIYAAWHDKRSGGFDVFSAVSTTDGTSWGENKQVNETTTKHGGAHPTMAIDSQGNIYLAWQDRRNPTSHIYLSVSGDNGMTWGKNVLIDDSLSGDKYRPSLAINSTDEVYLVWQDGRRGLDKVDVFFTKYKNQ